MAITMQQAVAMAKQGNREGQAYLYEQTYRKSYYIALKYLQNEDDVLDVLQDAYVKAFGRIEQLTDDDKFEKWLNSIVSTTALDALKKKKPQLFTDLSNDNEEYDVADRFEANYLEQPEVVIDQNETSRLVQEIIEELSDEQRVCVTMYYLQDMSVKEISNTLDVSDNTVMSRLHYARKNIEKKVKELEKKGTKLYAFAPLPFFLFLLGKDASACEATAAQGLYAVISSATVANASAGAAITSGTTTAATASTLSLGAKIAIGIVAAVAVIGGAIGIGVAVYNGNKTPDTQDESNVQNDDEVLTDYYNNTLLPQYSTADNEIALGYEDLGEGEFKFSGYAGNTGIMGKQFVDIDGDKKNEMLVAVSETEDVVDFYKGDDGIKTRILVFKIDDTEKQVKELTNGQIVSPSMKLYNDTIQCAYRIIDGKLYIYYTDVYTMSLHQGGMGYGYAKIYSFDGNTVNKLVDKPVNSNDYKETIEPIRQYMPTIMDAWVSLVGYGIYGQVPKAGDYKPNVDGTEGVLFVPLSKTDSSYNDIFFWTMTPEYNGTPVGRNVGRWHFFEKAKVNEKENTNSTTNQKSNNTVSAEEWTTAFINHINNVITNDLGGYDSSTYSLVDIDNDGIPEMFVSNDSTYGGGPGICTYSNGNVKMEGDARGSIEYIPGEGLVHIIGGLRWADSHRVYVINNSDLQLIVEGSSEINEAIKDFDSYTLNGVSSSKEEVANAIAKAFGNSVVTSTVGKIKIHNNKAIEDYGEKSYSHDEIIKYLNDLKNK